MTEKKMDLSALTTVQLKKLLADGAALLKRQESGAAALVELVAEVRKLAAAHKVPVPELVAALSRVAAPARATARSVGAAMVAAGQVPGVPATRAKATVKYRHGAQTWTGRGYQPAWIKSHLAAGGKLDDLKA